MQVSQKHTGRSLQKLLSLQNTCLCLAPLAVLGQSHLSRALLVPTSEAWCDFHWRGSQKLQQQLEQAIRKTPSKMKYMMEEIKRELLSKYDSFYYVNFPALFLFCLHLLQQFQNMFQIPQLQFNDFCRCHLPLSPFPKLELSRSKTSL